ncbi:MAG: GGDEF domain-containing protein [Nocardioidaceae bacterium]
MAPTALSARQRRITVALAVVGNVLPIALATLHDVSGHPGVFFLGAAVAVVAPVGVTLTPADRRLPRWVFAFGGLVGLTMLQAHSGGVSSPYAILLAMGMIWFGVMATPRELVVGMVAMVACCFLPMLLFGPPAYPVSLSQAAVLALVTTSVALSLGALTQETHRLTSQLRRDATHDQLTGLLNRRGWEEVTETALTEAAEGGYAVVMVDLDRLKEINDGLGHDEGDRVIRGTAERMGAVFHDQPAVTRLGGDEFAVLFVDTTADEAFGRVERLRASTPDRGAFSAGIALAVPGERLGDTMRRADLALYEAKMTGRGRVSLADPPIAIPEG